MKYTYKQWLDKAREFNSRKFRSNLQKNRKAIDEGLIPGSVSSYMELNKDKWHLSDYKPISERFRSEWFRPAAILRETTGKYCAAPYGSTAYKKFWDQEYDRCQHGFEINGFRAPGELYYWLNYYTLPLREKVGDDVTEELGHPFFMEYHYAWFHYLEWCWKKETDAVCLKPRGCGFSEVAGSMSTNTYTTKQSSKVMLCASFDGYLVGGDGLMDKASAQLDWLNANTQRGMKKLRQISDTKDVRTSGLKDKEGTTRGWKSTIMAKVIDKPSKLRGSRCRYVFMEESGSFNGLQKTIMAAKGLVKTGGLRMGTLIAWGTGGDEKADGKNIAGLMTCFYHPKAMGMMGLINPFTDTWEPEFQGFFFPAYAFSFVHYDKSGITDHVKVLESELEIRYELEKAGNQKGLIDHCAEYPFVAQEAFNQAGTNEFDRIKLEAIKRNLRMEGVPKVRKGELMWIKDDKNRITGVRFDEHPDGKVLILEEPEKDKFGKVHKNLYIGGVDGIDYGVDNSAIGEKGSKFGIVIKKKYLNSEKTHNIYVALYLERPSDEREAFERALKLAIHYNARLNVERTRKEVISYFRQRKMLKYISKEVSIVGNNANPTKAKKRAAVEGTTINTRTIEHYINRIKEYILDYGENLFFEILIDNLINFSYELKSKFDLVVAMGMCELLDEDDSALGVVVQKQKQKVTKQLWGHYINSDGYKQFGPIPNNLNGESSFDAHERLHVKYNNPMDEPEFEEKEHSPFEWSVADENEQILTFNL